MEDVIENFIAEMSDKELIDLMQAIVEEVEARFNFSKSEH